jgi:hypothetical protein
METVANALFATLRQMDKEACGQYHGFPTGLNFYGGHRRPELKRPPTETSWTQRLAELLPDHGFPTQAEVHYPSKPRWKCDDVLTLPTGGKLWLEVKGAWKKYWMDRDKLRIFHSYLLYHPDASGMDPKSHTVPLDLDKLSTLTREHAEAIGMLLLGFDSVDDPMDDDVSRLVNFSKLDRKPWCAFSTSWPDPSRKGERIAIWYWQRPVG